MEEKEIKKECNCDETCECGCNEGLECTCEENCGCEYNDECTCEDECHCDGETCDSNEKKDKKRKNKKEELKKAEEKIKELEDKLLREKAELINYRRRKDEEVARLLKYSNEDLILEMLPIIDNFESAIKMDDTNLEDEVSRFLQGFKMIYGNLITVLEKYDIKPIDGVNKPFDPTYHQAVMTEKIENVESGMVIDVLRKGYILKDKVIRPAMVKVSE
ncbi:MAG: nucleotide exchange factor GrpE [Bacilli bacterium]|nr:nucleotide exchange factor GrpE [Bacilli bacterium]